MPSKACLPSALADAPKSTFNSKRSGDSSCRSKISSIDEGSSTDLKRSTSGNSYMRANQRKGIRKHRTPSLIIPAVTTSEKTDSLPPYRNTPMRQEESSPDSPNANYIPMMASQSYLNNRTNDSLFMPTSPHTASSLVPPKSSTHPTSISGTSSSSHKPFDSASNSTKSAKSPNKTSRRNAINEPIAKKESTKSRFLRSLQRDNSDKSPSPPPVATVEFKLVEDLRLVTIPVTSCLLVLFAYIALGTILFANWENWTYLDGAYFCFISLLTIGFGDFVPGNDYIYHTHSKSDLKTEGNAKLISGVIYILLGLAIIAMCLNLMHEKIVVSVRTLARRLGLLRPSTFYFTDDVDDEDN